ncbi:MAG TPA: hypothetical protein VGK87_08020 [Anaerolineae bacterium]|jgi:hypothetical protein
MDNRHVHFQRNQALVQAMGLVVLALALLPSTFFVLGILVPVAPDPFAVFIPLIIGLFLIVLSRTRIVTSARGVEFHQFGFHAVTPWSNIVRIGLPPAASGTTEAIYLQRPCLQEFEFFAAWKLPLNLIPLYQFDYSPDSELGQELRRYKPHLFTD